MFRSEKRAEAPKFNPEVLVRNFENARIPLAPEFAEMYSAYTADLDRVNGLTDRGTNYGTQEKAAEVMLGKVSEAVIFYLLKKHEMGRLLQFRAASHYDDFFHGVDVLVEPRNANIQGFATLDITINQEDIKGRNRVDPDAREARPVGLEKKLERAKHYTDYLAQYDPTDARNLSSWINAGGLTQQQTAENRSFFSEAERLFLMKYYTAPDTAPEPGKPGFLIGGPKTIISVDTIFVNRVLQGNDKAKEMLGDIALLEFMYCIEAEQKYLDLIVKMDRSRNIFFDTHYACVKAWAHIFERPEMRSMRDDMAKKHYSDRDFREQLSYYAQMFQKIYGI